MRARLLLGFGLIALTTGCGLHPLYQGGTRSAAARQLAGVEVAPIPGKAGWLVHNAIVDRLAATSGGTPRYRLTVVLEDSIEGLGVRANDTVTRERRTLRARYQLHALDAPKDAPPLLDETANADAGIDVVSSEYATVAAEDTALERLATLIADRIIARVSVDAARRAER
jgi:LPS-assembly lipoprotein